MGPKKFAEWTRKQKRLLVTDTTFRDAHQSLFATRLRNGHTLVSCFEGRCLVEVDRLGVVYSSLTIPLLPNSGGLSVVDQQHEGITMDDLLIHDEKAEEPSLAYLLSRMVHPKFPEPIGEEALERLRGQLLEVVVA